MGPEALRKDKRSQTGPQRHCLSYHNKDKLTGKEQNNARILRLSQSPKAILLSFLLTFRSS